MVREKPKHRITITLEEEVFETIRKMADENDISIARVIRYALYNLLEERRQGNHQQLVLPLGQRVYMRNF